MLVNCVAINYRRFFINYITKFDQCPIAKWYYLGTIG